MNVWRLYILLIFLFGSISIRCQDFLEQYIPIPPQELSVEQFLYHIEEMTGFHPVYSSIIVENKKLSIYADSLTISDLLDTLFTVYNLQYIVRNDQLILSPQTINLQDENRIRITGIIRNSRNKNPIPYANVFVPFRSLGTISNSDGRFEMVIPLDEKIDSMMVTCLGYDGQSIMSLEFLKGPVDISLNPYRFQIEELIVRPKDPLLLINGMLANKADNYSTQPELITAFFREAIKQNDKYISLSEAVIDIYKASYTSPENDLIRLRKGRRGSNTEESKLVNLIVEGGLYNNLQLDVMKYNVQFLDPDFFSNYDYIYEKQIDLNGQPTYIISFKFKNNINLLGFNGKLFIDVKSLALVRAEFALNEESLDHAQSMLVKKVPKSFRVRPKHGKYEVEYRFYDGKWNLNYARSELFLKLRKKRERKKNSYLCHFLASSEFVITGKSTGKFEKIKYRDASKPKDILYEQVSNTDPDFWGNETIITPEEPLTITIKKLQIEEAVGEPNYVSTSGEE